MGGNRRFGDDVGKRGSTSSFMRCFHRLRSAAGIGAGESDFLLFGWLPGKLSPTSGAFTAGWWVLVVGFRSLVVGSHWLWQSGAAGCNRASESVGRTALGTIWGFATRRLRNSQMGPDRGLHKARPSDGSGVGSRGCRDSVGIRLTHSDTDNLGFRVKACPDSVAPRDK